MNKNLAIALYEKNVLLPGTEVHASYVGVGLGAVSGVHVKGDFSISSIEKLDDKLIFHLADLRSGVPTMVESEAIETIDGMDPIRFASVYDISSTGNTEQPKKRRGRKPKNRQIS